jgi:type IV secretory pathway VirJ component
MNSNKNGNTSQSSSAMSAQAGNAREQETPRRSWFAPIVLVLLVFSLIGNVFLYAEKLQDGKEDRTLQGLSIIAQALDAHSMIQGIGSRLETIATTESVETRMIQKQELARLMQYGQAALNTLIAQADGRGDRAPLEAADKQAAADFMSHAGAAMIAIGNDGEPLTAEEAAYVAMLQDSFIALEEISVRINFDPNPTDMMALQAAGGGEWVDIAYELASAMRKAELQPYKGI